MRTDPLRPILLGYGLAAAGGVAAAALFGVAPGIAVLAFWIGGAPLTLATAALTRRRRDAGGRQSQAEVAATLARWRADQREDAAPAARRRTDGA